MNKQEFLTAIRPVLKEMHFRKHSNYWYKNLETVMICINVQGSQWSKDTYYVEIGATELPVEKRTPVVWEWTCRHRCRGTDNEKIGPSLDTVIHSLLQFQSELSKAGSIAAFLSERDATKGGKQFFF